MEGRIKRIYRELYFPIHRCVGWFPRRCSYSSKNHYSFKHKYTISNMDLVGHSKRFLNVTCSAPGRTHDARLLLLTKVFSEIQSGRAIPLQYLDLGEGLGEISLVTIGYTAFLLIYLAVESFPREKRSKKALFSM